MAQPQEQQQNPPQPPRVLTIILTDQHTGLQKMAQLDESELDAPPEKIMEAVASVRDANPRPVNVIPFPPQNS